MPGKVILLRVEFKGDIHFTAEQQQTKMQVCSFTKEWEHDKIRLTEVLIPQAFTVWDQVLTLAVLQIVTLQLLLTSDVEEVKEHKTTLSQCKIS